MRAPLLLHHRQTKTLCLDNSTRHQMIVCFGRQRPGAASTQATRSARRWPGRAAPDETYPRGMSDSEVPVVSRVVTALCGGRQLDLLGDIPLNIPVDEPKSSGGIGPDQHGDHELIVEGGAVRVGGHQVGQHLHPRPGRRQRPRVGATPPPARRGRRPAAPPEHRGAAARTTPDPVRHPAMRPRVAHRSDRLRRL
jgi:hypothetical protein